MQNNSHFIQEITLKQEILLPVLINLIPILLKSFYDNAKTFSFKKDKEFFLKEDTEINYIIKKILCEQFPFDGFVSEEDEPIESKNKYTWVLDPIDGSRNFALDISFFCISLALFYEEKAVLSFVVEPLQEKIYLSLLENNFILKKNKEKIPIKPFYSKSIDLGEYSLSGGVFGILKKPLLEKIQTQWFNMAFHATRYRSMGATALDIITTSLWRDNIFFTLKVRLIDVAAAIHFVHNLGYNFIIGKNYEFLVIFPAYSGNIYLDQFLHQIKENWETLNLNSMKL